MAKRHHAADLVGVLTCYKADRMKQIMGTAFEYKGFTVFINRRGSGVEVDWSIRNNANRSQVISSTCMSCFDIGSLSDDLKKFIDGEKNTVLK